MVFYRCLVVVKYEKLASINIDQASPRYDRQSAREWQFKVTRDGRPLGTRATPNPYVI